jgi:hypothetical protein
MKRVAFGEVRNIDAHLDENSERSATCSGVATSGPRVTREYLTNLQWRWYLKIGIGFDLVTQ